MKATRDGAYFCQWCATGDHRRCASEACACRQRAHVPDVKLGRRMLISQSPDLAAAINRGGWDEEIGRLHGGLA